MATTTTSSGCGPGTASRSTSPAPEGASPYAVDESDTRLAWSDDSRFGALRIVLEPGRATFEFRDTAGRLLDRSRQSCTTG